MSTIRRRKQALLSWKTRSAAFRNVWEALKDIGITTSDEPHHVLKKEKGPFKDDELKLYAHYFLAMFAVRTKRPLFTKDQKLLNSVYEAFVAHLLNKERINHENVDFVIALSNALGAVLSLHLRLAQISGTLKHMQILVESVRETIPLLAIATLQKVVEFLTNTPSVSINRFISGNVRKTDFNTFVFETKNGALLQLGIPPETIKPYLSKGEIPPNAFLLPSKLFEMDARINSSDIEFPIYHSFFVRGALANPEKRVIIIGEHQQIEAIRTVFSESFYGPKKEHIYEDDIVAELRDNGYAVDFAKERKSLAYHDKDGNVPPVEAFANFVTIKDGVAEFDIIHNGSTQKVRITRDQNGVVACFEDNERTGVVDGNGPVVEVDGGCPVVSLDASEHAQASLESTLAFEPPVFGVTFLGTSHGFDPKGRTTGFIVWVNGVGMLVDPPYQTRELLQLWGIDRRFVRKAMLTHCHADHESGLFRMMVEGERVELYTTRTINDSYCRKMSALLGNDVSQYYMFNPVRIGESTRILGASFHFQYAYHSIPCLRFRATLHGRTIAYSADTFYEPSVLSRLYREGVFNAQRERVLQLDLFQADLIIHECGVPPIHTPVAALNELPVSIKQKMVLVHCHGLPETVNGSDGVERQVRDLRLGKAGLLHTERVDVGQFAKGFSAALTLAHMLADVFYLKRVTATRIHALVEIAERREVSQGTVVMREGELSDCFYVVYAGQLRVEQSVAIDDDDDDETFDVNNNTHTEVVATLYRGSSFGEQALLPGTDRTTVRRGTVIALCQCSLYAIPRQAFLSLLRDKGAITSAHSVAADVSRVVRYRAFLREALKSNALFHGHVESIAAAVGDEIALSAGTVLFEQGDVDKQALYFVLSGVVKLLKDGVEFIRVHEGQAFGEMSLITGMGRNATAVAHTEAVLLPLPRDRFLSLVDEFPSLRFNVTTVVEGRLKETKRVGAHLSQSQGGEK